MKKINLPKLPTMEGWLCVLQLAAILYKLHDPDYLAWPYVLGPLAGFSLAWLLVCVVVLVVYIWKGVKDG